MEAVALRHLGLVKVFRVGAHVMAKWDMRLVAESAIAALLETLQDSRGIAKVTLYFYVDGWCRETCAGAHESIRRIGQIQRYRAISTILDPQARELDLDRARTAMPLLRLGLRAWQQSGGRLQDLWHDGARWLLNRSLIVAHGGRGGEAGFAYMGRESAAVRVFGTHWRDEAVGNLIGEAIPQLRYQSRMASAYQSILETGEPRYDHVRARLIFTRQGEPIWSTYQRLLLPCVDKRGERAVLAVNELTEDVEIPFLAAA
jgi:hypothetical protein